MMIQRKEQNRLIGSPQTFVAKGSVAVALILLCAASLNAQEATKKPAEEALQLQSSPLPERQAAAKGKLEFDAASVRLSSEKFLGYGADFLDTRNELEPPKGGLIHWNATVGALINFAYDLRNPRVSSAMWQSLPKWAQDNWYTVRARAEGNPTRADVRAMTRSLLEERFQFAGHMEKRNGQVYALVVAAKPGPRFKPHPEGAPCTLPLPKGYETEYPHIYPAYDSYVGCGTRDRGLSNSGEVRYEMLNVTMQQIADILGQPMPMSVVDKTGLAGRYDAVVDFRRDDPPPDADTSDAIGLPSLPSAIEKQLGLKLVKQNATVDAFVVDHLEMPSEN